MQNSSLANVILLIVKMPAEGLEPWSSGYGKSLTFQGRGFESLHRILDGHFFTFICCKNCNVCLGEPKINEKEAGVGPFFTRYLNVQLWRIY